MSEAVRSTRNYVVIRRDAARSIAQEVRHLHQLVEEVRREHASDRALLESALIELARATGAKDARLFSRRWQRAHRAGDDLHLSQSTNHRR